MGEAPLISQSRIVLISADEKIRNLITFSLESNFRIEVAPFKNGREGLSYLKESKGNLSAIVYDVYKDDYEIDDIIKNLSDQKKSVPFIVIAGKDIIDNAPKDSPFKFIEKEQIIKGLNSTIKSMFKVDKSYEPEDFCRVSIDSLNIFDGISNDLYIQLSSGRFLKLFQKGDELSKEDIEKYRLKGVSFLFLKQRTCRWVLDQIHSQVPLFLKTKNFKFILRSPELPPEKKLEQKLIRTYDDLHITDDFKKEIEEKVERAMQAIRNHPKFKEPFKLLKLNQEKKEYMDTHIALLIVSCSALAKAMGWHSKITLEKLVYAAILHDISLAVKPYLAEIKDVEQLKSMDLSKEDMKMYLDHPTEISKLVKSAFQLAPPDTEIIIYQHHELPNGKGFPKKITSGRITPLSTLFIIAHELVDYVIDNETLDLEDFILKAEQRFNSINFNKVIHSLKKLLPKKAAS